MKHLRLFLALLLAFAVLSPAPAFAAKKSKGGATAMGDACPVLTELKKLKTFNGKPNANAKYFFYLCSASWCGPCQREMPEIVKAHKAMKKDGRCEIILVGYDNSLDEAKGYLKSHKAKFCGVWKDDKHIKDLPGYGPVPGIPYAILVNRAGKVLAVQHAKMIQDWKQVADNADAQESSSTADTETDTPAEDAGMDESL